MNKLSIGQLYQVPWTGGMSYVITLRDEGFIIIDGGQASRFYRDHEKVLFEYLVKRSGDKKPKILGWFFTHFHLDHVACAGEFLIEHKDDIEVDGFYINPPGDDDNTRDFEMEEVLKKGMDAHPDTERHYLNTGDKFEFPHCSVDLLLSATDLCRYGYTSPNHISAVFRVAFDNGTSFLVTGDSDNDRMLRLFDPNDPLYRPFDELKCDVFQSPHHGRILGNHEEAAKFAEVLKEMKPKIAFFPICQGSYDTDEFYSSEAWADNYYLIHSGAKCFHHSETVTVDMDNFSFEVE